MAAVSSPPTWNGAYGPSFSRRRCEMVFRCLLSSIISRKSNIHACTSPAGETGRRPSERLLTRSCIAPRSISSAEAEECIRRDYSTKHVLMMHGTCPRMLRGHLLLGMGKSSHGDSRAENTAVWHIFHARSARVRALHIATEW